MMKRTDTIAYCRREAARLRSLLPMTGTPAIRARLTEQIEDLERIAKGETPEPPELELTIAKSPW